jgi:adenylate cyclase
MKIHLPSRAVQNFLLAGVVASLSVVLSSPDLWYHPALTPFYAMERAGYDFLFTFRGTAISRIDPRIQVIGFDRRTEQDLKTRWVPPRHYHADVIKNLHRDGAALIVYDVLFSDGTTAKEDRALDEALKEAGNVVVPFRIDRDSQQKRKSLEESYYNDSLGIDFLASAVDGFAEVPPDTDSVIRRMAPVMYFREWRPSLAAAAYLKLTGRDQNDVSVSKTGIRIGDVVVPRSGPTVRDASADGSIIPSAYMDFPAGNAAFALDFNFSDVALGRFPPGTFRGKIVFVGLTGAELTRESFELTRTSFDQYVTAFTNYSTESSVGSIGYVKAIPGVFLQALNLNALLRQGFVTHLPIWSVWVLVFGITIAGSSAMRSSFNWRGPAVLVLGVLLYILYAVQMFEKFLVHVPWIVPSTLVLSSIMAVTYFERGALKKKWAGYVSPQVLERILRSEEELFAQRCDATVVFGDIRGFTFFTKQHSPETVVKLLNMHFERMTEIIYEQNGTIDKFFGDGIMALFGIPISRPDSAVCAVRSAWFMCLASKEPIHLDGEAYVMDSGFGVTTGSLVAGHVGSKARHEYTVIGDVVNMASRLQGVTGTGDVIIDHPTYEQVKSHVTTESLGAVQVKGSPLPVQCYKVTGWSEVVPKMRRAKGPKSTKAGKESSYIRP